MKLSLLRLAQVRAARDAVPAADCLMASGGVSPLLYYKALADRLGCRFVQSGVAVTSSVAVGAAIRTGRAEMENGPARFLLAPRGRAIEALLREDAADLDAVFTTPARFAAMVRRAAAATIVHEASDSLPERDPTLSAKGAGGAGLAATLAGVILVSGTVVALAPATVMTLVGLLFFCALVFRLLLCASGLDARDTDASPLSDAELPFYSVLVPLYREARMAPDLIARLDRLDYPRSKLEILLLVEADDPDTSRACLEAGLACHYDVVVVPPGEPRTKPRAMNVALPSLRGEVVTIFDAEDVPDPSQLRRAAARFRDAAPDVACLQARLAIHNGADCLLSRLFSLEYAALFDLFNAGVAQLRLPMALGGTSNHFRTDALRHVGGWDAWNVAEDADLGFRLARFGFRTEALAATTREEAPVTYGNWFRQRRRWTKGWLQTAIVLGRRPRRVLAELGLKQTLAVGLMLTTLVIGPLAILPLSVVTLGWVAVAGLPPVGTPLEEAQATLWTSVFALGVVSVLWSGWAGGRIRRLATPPPLLLGLLPYQALIGLAAWGGLIDLVVQPHHWHKTQHGVAARPRERSRSSIPRGRWGGFDPPAFVMRGWSQPLRALRAAYFASRAALRDASSAMTRDARANAAAASAAFASSARRRSASR